MGIFHGGGYIFCCVGGAAGPRFVGAGVCVGDVSCELLEDNALSPTEYFKPLSALCTDPFVADNGVEFQQTRIRELEKVVLAQHFGHLAEPRGGIKAIP